MKEADEMKIKIACSTGFKEEDWKVCDYLKSCEKWPTVSDAAAATGCTSGRSLRYASDCLSDAHV